MKLKKLNPTSNGCRHQLNLNKSELSKNNFLLKINQKGIKHQSGRSSQDGKITVRHKGGGCKTLYSKILLNNEKFIAIVLSINYDSSRGSFLSLNYNLFTKSFFNTLAVNYIAPGSILLCHDNSIELKLGYRTQIKKIPAGSIINCVSTSKEVNYKYIRSAGSFGQLLQKDLHFAKIKLPSGNLLSVPLDSFATLGSISNSKKNLVIFGKAGKKRLLGHRPSVRGIAMNPVDHPHGGRTNGGRPSVTPWGLPTKGKPTVKKK